MTTGTTAPGVVSPFDVSNTPTEMILLGGASEPDCVATDVAGGHAIAYTCRDPYKETDNEVSLSLNEIPATSSKATISQSPTRPTVRRAML